MSSRLIAAALAVGVLSVSASAQIIGGGFTFVYATDGAGTTISGSSGTPLANIGPGDVLQFAPGLVVSTEKIHTAATTNALLGDEDGDGDHFESIFGAIDALEYLHYPPNMVPFPFGNLTDHDVVWSVRESFGGSGASTDNAPHGAADGSLFRFVADANGNRVQILLAETAILGAIGQSAGLGDDIDVDAFAQDDMGNVYLSFDEDELVNGNPVQDGSVVVLPIGALTVQPDGTITAVASNSAVELLNESDLDAMIVATGIAGTQQIGDLRDVVMDPGGGTFLGRDGQFYPHLMFITENQGPNVFSTANGGRFGQLNFVPTGTVNSAPATLGFATFSGALSALAITDDRPRALTCDVYDGEVDWLGGETHVEWDIGNCTPNSPVIFIIGISPGTPGIQTISAPILGKVYPEFLPIPIVHNLVFTLPSDANGILQFNAVLTHSISPHVLIAQAYDVGSDQLGAPGAMWFP
jgi:hypothetical protein